MAHSNMVVETERQSMTGENSRNEPRFPQETPMNLASRSWTGESTPAPLEPIPEMIEARMNSNPSESPARDANYQKKLIQEYEITLMELVSNLEFHRGELDEQCQAQDFRNAIESILKMADHLGRYLRVFSSAGKAFDSENANNSDRIGPIMGHAVALRDKLPSFWSFKALVRKWKRDVHPEDMTWLREFRECLLQLHECQQDSFARFTNRFPSSLDARAWVGTASTFLADFKRIINDLPV